MRNIIPQNLSASNDEVMSPELKRQFLELQLLQHREAVSQLPLHHNSPVGSGTDLLHLYDGPNESISYEEKSNTALISRRSSEADTMNLAVSTAIRAQHEIEVLLRSIAELEKMVNYNMESTSSTAEEIPGRSFIIDIGGVTHSTPYANVVDDEAFE